ncbi:DMSO/TMAO reductase YedYZ molybdopterin-dependent catalytic subunit [Luteibacter sp. Sphag1AF]|uniref:molybdopterin-dependent oxidoreductase n=1 Tax=Luteibacter sp. Sphag1AF TaxID=2587031 RepID=UPI00160B1DB7|nr:molybdopterin-dependent oxidoreductase [Luteibacter sp. Sphag1AF]MBB3225636.1 DMSO/TMAO reductase YedYZ molybdopterin-dependent catalytic subunit [Luteibacter sp. Sphag1AF]
MRIAFTCGLAACLLLAPPLTRAAESPATISPASTVTLTTAALEGLVRTHVSGSIHGGPVMDFEGVALMDVLRKAGAVADGKLTGRAMANVVRVTATDGYTAAFSIAELSPDVGAGTVIVADKANGKAIEATDGPFRLVVPGDRRPARWVRQAVRLDVFDLGQARAGH